MRFYLPGHVTENRGLDALRDLVIINPAVCCSFAFHRSSRRALPGKSFGLLPGVHVRRVHHPAADLEPQGPRTAGSADVRAGAEDDVPGGRVLRDDVRGKTPADVLQAGRDVILHRAGRRRPVALDWRRSVRGVCMSTDTPEPCDNAENLRRVRESPHGHD